MGVRAEKLRSFHADGAIAESRAFGGAGRDADVLQHDLSLQPQRHPRRAAEEEAAPPGESLRRLGEA